MATFPWYFCYGKHFYTFDNFALKYMKVQEMFLTVFKKLYFLEYSISQVLFEPRAFEIHVRIEAFRMFHLKTH